MYVSRSEISVDGENETDYIAMHQALHDAMKPALGFRWAMLLRSLEDSSRLAAVALWQSPAHAEAFTNSAAATANAEVAADDDMSPPAPAREYDVATARGPMSPAAFAAIVDWDIEDAPARKGFVERWNAAYHAIEDKLGSRLLAELSQPSRFAGLHVAQDKDDLSPHALSGKVERREELGFAPKAIARYEVILLSESG